MEPQVPFHALATFGGGGGGGGGGVYPKRLALPGVQTFLGAKVGWPPVMGCQTLTCVSLEA